MHYHEAGGSIPSLAVKTISHLLIKSCRWFLFYAGDPWKILFLYQDSVLYCILHGQFMALPILLPAIEYRIQTTSCFIQGACFPNPAGNTN